MSNSGTQAGHSGQVIGHSGQGDSGIGPATVLILNVEMELRKQFQKVLWQLELDPMSIHFSYNSYIGIVLLNIIPLLVLCF